MEQKKHIVIIAGEASGDMHAAMLVKEIKKNDPSCSFSGLGGPKMAQEGVELYHDMTEIAVVGFWEVLKHYDEFKRIFKIALWHIHKRQPKAVILVDYPGFNLRLAKELNHLRKHGLKVIYYISPQVWAWKENRINLIKKYIDKMLVLFSFEKELYAKHGVDADFVGHPLIDAIKLSVPKEQIFSNLGLPEYKTTIGLLPGSREKEVQKHLPIMLETAQLLLKDFPMLQFLVIRASSINENLIVGYLAGISLPIKIVDQNTYDAINACEACIVSSGTATLETAIIGKPMVVIYKTSFLTWLLARIFVKIPDIGLVNVVAGKRIVPECVQYQATAENIAGELKKMLAKDGLTAAIIEELKKVKESLGTTGASVTAAQIVVESIN